MNKFFLFTLFLLLTMNASLAAQDILLPKPQNKGGMPLMEALNTRHSSREYSTTKTLSQQQLSNLLWAACGINREDGRRTSPTAINAQELDVFVFNREGIYLYMPTENKLKHIKDGDFRIQATPQESAQSCPLLLVYVAYPDRFGRMDAESRMFYCATDTGFISQNVYLFCAQEGLNTVVMGRVNREEVQQILGLENAEVMLAQPVGFPR